MILALAPTGIKLSVLKILTDEKTKKHLENLGITLGSELTVISQGGATILLIKDFRLALDGNIATKILVKVQK